MGRIKIRKRFYVDDTDDRWMYNKNQRKKMERPVKLPPLPPHWPTDRLSKVVKRPEGVFILSHPDRDILYFHPRVDKWVEFTEMKGRTQGSVRRKCKKK
jgi:hypothetical protein